MSRLQRTHALTQGRLAPRLLLQLVLLDAGVDAVRTGQRAGLVGACGGSGPRGQEGRPLEEGVLLSERVGCGPLRGRCGHRRARLWTLGSVPLEGARKRVIWPLL